MKPSWERGVGTMHRCVDLGVIPQDKVTTSPGVMVPRNSVKGKHMM